MPARVTTGLIPIRFSGGNPTLRLYVTSFAGRSQAIGYQVAWVQPEGTKAPLHEGTLTVGPRRTSILSFDNVQGRTVEVNLDIPHPGVKPTVAVVGTFLADGAEQILALVSPDGFVLRDPAVAPGLSPNARDRVRVVSSRHTVTRMSRPRRRQAMAI